MESKKISIDFVNGGEPFQIPPLNSNIRTELCLDILKISVDAEKEFQAYKGTTKYDLMLQQRIDQKILTRILQEIDPQVTPEQIDSQGITWIVKTLTKVYENAPDKKTDFLKPAEEKIDSPLPNNTMTSKDISTALQSPPDTP